MPRYKIILLSCALLLMFVACTTDGRPSDVMSQAEMIPVLADLEVVYAGIDQTVKSPSERQKRYAEMNALVLKKHHVDQERFYHSYQWYETNPVLLDTIFKQVASKLTEDLNQLQSGDGAKPRPAVPILH